MKKSKVKKKDHPLPVDLNSAEIEEFGLEIEAIRTEVMDSRGERDERYIRRMLKVQRSLALGGRLVIFASLAFLPQWNHAFATWLNFWPIICTGVLSLGIAKIIENMEIAHNVMHAQWDWMRDPTIQSGSWEWDNTCPSDQWKHSHNVKHHTWTNVFGKDSDVGGYGVLRMFPEQPWKPKNIGNPIYAILLAILFEWGVAVQEFELTEGTKRPFSEIKPMAKRTGIKMLRQILKDYVLFPALAGPFFLYVMAANAVAGVIRNVWTYMIIFSIALSLP